MKFSIGLLGLAVSAIAAQVDPRWAGDTTTVTTYTTTTVCPYTSTVTEKGT
jgi:hypothetical protein